MEVSDSKDSIPADDASIRNGKTDMEPADQAAKFVAAHAGYAPMTPEMERRIKRKIDLWLVPLGAFTVTLAAVDKVQLGTAALYDFIEDNGLTGSQYSWLGSILFVGVSLGPHSRFTEIH